MDQVVQALGVTKPFVYYRFRSKKEIFEVRTWRAAVPSFTAFDYPDDDLRPAHEKLAEGVERLIRSTIDYYPSAFFAYRDPQAYRPEFSAELNRLAEHMYGKMCALMKDAQAAGTVEFGHTRVAAMAACSIPGFLYTWYRPSGRLPPEVMVQELTVAASRDYSSLWRRFFRRNMSQPPQFSLMAVSVARQRLNKRQDSAIGPSTMLCDSTWNSILHAPSVECVATTSPRPAPGQMPPNRKSPNVSDSVRPCERPSIYNSIEASLTHSTLPSISASTPPPTNNRSTRSRCR